MFLCHERLPAEKCILFTTGVLKIAQLTFGISPQIEQKLICILGIPHFHLNMMHPRRDRELLVSKGGYILSKPCWIIDLRQYISIIQFQLYINRVLKVASYLIRLPISLERLFYDDQNANITYQGKRDVYHFHPLTFLAQLSLHIANHGEQMVRYYGWYSNKKRGMRKKEGMGKKPMDIKEDFTDYQKSCRKRWSALIRKIYEVDPLICPKCGATMKILLAIEDDVTIHKILSHLGLLYPPNRSPPSVITTPWEKKEECSYFADLIPDVDVYCRDV
ncbi:MAG: hypothetical protein A3F81_04810 [Nitrospinae bacterium RIFCSPLOWO2_12_FULL_39_93]|nr:MAG: hypothetical protein A3D97_08805 [Nitrospinae bacterium RIFCSPHIGHO2_12_FULL_39_42]OGW09322.1 MAG: hypothetical protein A3F81_04810 [Nitrospinae bacterium RIFCSPLOWO2_12_FULL_39_93]